MKGLTGGCLVPKLTPEEIEWVRTATYEQWVERHGKLCADIAFTDVTQLYKRQYPVQSLHPKLVQKEQ